MLRSTPEQLADFAPQHLAEEFACTLRVNSMQAVNGATPLFLACQEGHTETAATLLAAGAAVDQAEDNGATPLFVACQNGHTEIVTKLLED